MGAPQLHRVLLQSLILASVAFAKTPNYDEDIRPIFARRCFGCHNSSEMRSGLSLETYAGVMKGGGSGDAVVPGRATASLLYKAVMHEEGAPLMPLGLPRLPDSEIGLIRDWIAGGVPENATSAPKAPAGPSLDYRPPVRPAGAPVMPESLPPLHLPEPVRANPVTALAMSPWAPLLAWSGHERVYLYNLETRRPAGELPFPEGIPYALRFSRSGEQLLAAGGRGVQSGKAVLYDVRTGRRLATVGNERDIVLAADVSADGKLIALGGPGKVVRVFSVPDGKLLYELQKHTDWITALEFSPDGTRLATGDRAGGIFVWESATGAAAGNLAEHKDSVTALSWRGDGQLLASSSEDGQIVVWNIADGFPVTSVAKAHPGVLGVQFGNDGLLYSVGRDNAFRIWSADGKRKGSGTAGSLPTKVAVGAGLAATGGYDGRITVWNGTAAAFTITSPAPAGSASGPRED